MKRIEQHPPWWRLALGLVLAPLVGPLVFALFVEVISSGNSVPAHPPPLAPFLALAAIALATAAVVGLPALVFLVRRAPLTLGNCTAVGTGVAVLPWVALTVFAAVAPGQSVLLTVAAFSVLASALAGMLGGMSFWLIAAAGWEPKVSIAASTTEV